MTQPQPITFFSDHVMKTATSTDDLLQGLEAQISHILHDSYAQSFGITLPLSRCVGVLFGVVEGTVVSHGTATVVARMQKKQVEDTGNEDTTAPATPQLSELVNEDDQSHQDMQTSLEQQQVTTKVNDAPTAIAIICTACHNINYKAIVSRNLQYIFVQNVECFGFQNKKLNQQFLEAFVCETMHCNYESTDDLVLLEDPATGNVHNVMSDIVLLQVTDQQFSSKKDYAFDREVAIPSSSLTLKMQKAKAATNTPPSKHTLTATFNDTECYCIGHPLGTACLNFPMEQQQYCDLVMSKLSNSSSAGNNKSGKLNSELHEALERSNYDIVNSFGGSSLKRLCTKGTTLTAIETTAKVLKKRMFGLKVSALLRTDCIAAKGMTGSPITAQPKSFSFVGICVGPAPTRKAEYALVEAMEFYAQMGQLKECKQMMSKLLNSTQLIAIKATVKDIAKKLDHVMTLNKQQSGEYLALLTSVQQDLVSLKYSHNLIGKPLSWKHMNSNVAVSTMCPSFFELYFHIVVPLLNRDELSDEQNVCLDDYIETWKAILTVQ